MTVEASGLKVGAPFDIQKLVPNKKPADSTIVAFMPSLTYDCEYASMLTQSFYFYFDRQMAFEKSAKKPQVRIILVVRDSRNEAKSAQNIIGDMNVVYDEKGEMFSHFGIEDPYGKNANSTVVLLDSNEKIVHIDAGYRAQGERLKPLENKLKEITGVEMMVSAPPVQKSLKVGDTAPNFLVEGGQTLKDLRGRVVLISFYPAAFSGSFPRPYDAGPVEPLKPLKPKLDETLSAPVKFTGVPAGFSVSEGPGSIIGPPHSRPGILPDNFPISCSFQIDALDLKGTNEIKTARRILVSSSTRPLLEQWRNALRTESIVYANDPDYWISGQYASYNPAGYNNRVSVIVDQKGKIAYVDESFDAADEAVIERKINELLKKK